MKCKYCGAEIPDNEQVCPECHKAVGAEPNEAAAPQVQEEAPAQETEPKKKKHTGLIALAAVLLCGVAAAGFFISQKSNPAADPSASSSDYRSMVSFTTKRTLNTVIPGTAKPLTMYNNDSYKLGDYSSIAPMIRSDSIYIGEQNYAQLDDELIYINTRIEGMSPSSQYPDASHTLYILKKGSTEPAVLDENVDAIQCASHDTIYYTKRENGMLMQYRYSKGETVPVTSFIDTDMALVTDCSDDGSVFAFIGLKKGEPDPSKLDIEGNPSSNNIATNGYSANGKVHFFESQTSNVHAVSNDGKTIYVTDVPEQSRTAHMMVVSNLETGELKTISESISEALMYEETGDMLCVGNVTLGDDIMNPVGDLVFYDASAADTFSLPVEATAIVESAPKSYAWLNESSKEMIVTEQSDKLTVPHSASKNENLHYIDKNGNLCAVNLEGDTFVIQEGFYTPESYAFREGLFYLTQKGDSFYWALDNKVYRYVIDSMAAPQEVTLDAPIMEKVDAASKMGYVLEGNGLVIEQTDNTLNCKDFSGDSFTVYDSPEPVTVIGMNNAGDALYFISGDKVLYEKAIHKDSEPVKLAENVFNAVAVTDGVYMLRDMDLMAGGTLEVLRYGEKAPVKVAENVISLGETVMQ